jgi:transcription initiation factor IIE alpha subunit
MAQKSEIEEMLEFQSHRAMFYPKFHCELNHIEYFWCHSKQSARENCDYTIEGLQKHLPASLAHVRNNTILACYNSCMRKMDLYRQGVMYGSNEWKRLTSHQKPYAPGEDR